MTPIITTPDTLRGELPTSPSVLREGKSQYKDVDFLNDVETTIEKEIRERHFDHEGKPIEALVRVE